MSELAIKVEGLSKRYRIGAHQQAYRTLREKLNDTALAPFRAMKSATGRNGHNSKPAIRNTKSETFWALRDVSFEVKQGEVVGIIGRNGAGKSTLLKILSRITEPTEGYADIHGRIASLLEVGTGFHPELSGRENIFLNGSILGMKRVEIRKKFDEMVAFAEIEKFIDTPVKHYSSGMYVRLAFAVAAHLDPEILLVDEVLAVGDAAFQKKCLGKMSDVAREGRTVLFVSHTMGAINGLCDRTLWFDGGKIQASGLTAEIVTAYLAEIFENKTGDLEQLRSSGFGEEVKILDVKLVTNDGSTVLFGQPLKYRLVVHSASDLTNISIGSSIFNSSGNCVGTLITKDVFSIKSNQQLTLHLTVSDSHLAPGSYYSGFSLGHGGRSGQRCDFDQVIGKPAFHVLPVSETQGEMQTWNLTWGNIVFDDIELTVEAS
jgi:lipopolysaccharide transport system ATP-binding protein